MIWPPRDIKWWHCHDATQLLGAFGDGVGVVDRERDTPVRRHIIAELVAGHQLQPADRVGEPSGCASFAMTLAHAWIIPLEEVPVTRDAPQPARVTLVAVSSALSTEM